jgi:hypothetical protein
MNSSRNQKLGAIAVAVVALAGVGTAYAASKLHSGSSSASAASNSGALAAGGQQATPPSTRGNGSGYRGGFGFGGRPGGGRGFGFGGPGGGFSAATAYLGISQTQLFTDIRSGKTLAQIANSTSGKSASGLIDAMVAAQRSQLDAAVKSGRITQAMATQIESNLKSRVTQMVNGGFGRFGGRGGFGGGNGFGSPPTQTPSQSQPGSGTSPT